MNHNSVFPHEELSSKGIPVPPSDLTPGQLPPPDSPPESANT